MWYTQVIHCDLFKPLQKWKLKWGNLHQFKQLLNHYGLASTDGGTERTHEMDPLELWYVVPFQNWYSCVVCPCSDSAQPVLGECRDMAEEILQEYMYFVLAE